MINDKSAHCIHMHNILLQVYPLVPWQTTRYQEMNLAKDIERKMLECLGHVIKSGYNMAEKISVGKP